MINLKDFFDPYERNARLFPPLIILFPVFVAVYCLFSDLRNLLSAAAGSIIFVLIFYYLGKASREIGKKKQEKLIIKWDGMPSTRFLRHRDNTYDEHTKGRYHSYLQTHVPNLIIPTLEEELENPEKADLIYQSAVIWLLKKTRDTEKYSLLFKDNINYGFARNFWALKYWGIVINLLVLAGTAALIYHRYHFNLSLIPHEVWLSVGITIIIILFILLFKEEAVHSKAKAYARTLLEVCDEEDKIQ